MDTIAPATIRPRRSFLFVPGTGPQLFPKALVAAPDIVCVDLEDAIAPDDKVSARTATLPLFAQYPNDGQVERLVRINALNSADGLADLLALLECDTPPNGIMVPKVKSPDDIRLLDDLFTSENSKLRIQVIIETNEALEACFDIAQASTRVDALLFGGADMSAELRLEPTWEAQ